MNHEIERDPAVVLTEAQAALALAATIRLYEEQPSLWEMGEHGRARTHEDFGHHFRALAPLTPDTFLRHVEYCEALFDQRGFPRKWLEDAWKTMDAVLAADLPAPAHEPARRILREVTTMPPRSGSGADGG